MPDQFVTPPNVTFKQLRAFHAEHPEYGGQMAICGGGQVKMTTDAWTAFQPWVEQFAALDLRRRQFRPSAN